MLSFLLGGHLGVKLLAHKVVSYMFNLVKKLPNHFLKYIYYFIFQPKMYESIHCSVSLSTVPSVGFSLGFFLCVFFFWYLFCCHSNECEIVSHLNLHFPVD